MKKYGIIDNQLAVGKCLYSRLSLFSMQAAILSFLLLIALSRFVNAQETVKIDLETVLKLGGAKNLTIKEYKERQELSMAKLAKARQWWVPEIYAGAERQQLWGASMNADGRFFLDVNRQNFWGGLGLNANWDFASGIYRQKAAKFSSLAEKYNSKAERNQTLLKVINAYYDLRVEQLAFTAYQNLVEQADSIAQQIQTQVEAGMLYPSEALLAKSNKNHLKVEMLNAQKRYYQVSAELLKLLNMDQSLKLVSTEEALLPLTYNEQDLMPIDSAQLNRPEIKANQLEVQSLEIRKKQFTSGLLLPELNLGAYGSYFGRLSGDFSPMVPAEFPDPDRFHRTEALNVSLMWRIPLGELFYKGDRKTHNSLIRLKQIEGEQLEAQIYQELSEAQFEINNGKEQIEITKEALDFSAEAMEQSVERQKIGTAKPFEVFQAQQFFLQAQIDYLKAIGAYNKAQFALKVAKGEEL